jgi:octaprenyl-diphosphate synthase
MMPATTLEEKRLDLKALRAALPEWTAFEKYYESVLYAEVYRKNWLLERLIQFLFRQQGKQIRPLLLLYMAKATGTITESSFIGATMIEILHNATLAHDDVVDDADYRRGFFSFRALWGNRVAVLWGDWLLARGLLLALRHDQPQLLTYTSEAVEALAEGELLQLKRMREANLTTDSYFAVIDKKTAALFEATCRMGAYSAGASQSTISQAGMIGQRIGRGFQLRDDLLDWEASQLSGKPRDADRKQKRFTLPLIWAMQRASTKEKHTLLHGSFSETHTLLEKMGAFTYTEQMITEIYEESLCLIQALPQARAIPLGALFHLLLFRQR